MSLADAIAILRAASAIPIAWAILADARGAALVLFVAASVSDAVDGQVARRMGGASALGELLDPLADKVLVTVTLVALSAVGTGWPVTLVAAGVLVREAIVGAARAVAYARGVRIPADTAARAKTAVQMAGVALIVLGGRPWSVLGTGLVGLAFLVSIAALPRYLRAARATA